MNILTEMRKFPLLINIILISSLASRNAIMTQSKIQEGTKDTLFNEQVSILFGSFRKIVTFQTKSNLLQCIFAFEKLQFFKQNACRVSRRTVDGMMMCVRMFLLTIHVFFLWRTYNFRHDQHSNVDQ